MKDIESCCEKERNKIEIDKTRIMIRTAHIRVSNKFRGSRLCVSFLLKCVCLKGKKVKRKKQKKFHNLK